ncbi:MAG: response regulator transcription factor [Verrucomicrobia bacterium]|nr:response regulator transcription factor [Verrucomicrobiota bacterium]
MAKHDTRLLVVEDNRKVADGIASGLTEEGYGVVIARTAAQASESVEGEHFALALLDLGLPDGRGLDILKSLREQAEYTKVIILTARDSITDRVDGLDAGADDYIVKPFSFPELLARIRAQLRTAGQPDVLLEALDLKVDLMNRRVIRGGKEIELTTREFDLLRYLMQNKGRNVTREMLAADVWKVTARATPLDNVIDVHVSHLRDKIDKPFDLKLIHTVRGVGFILREH